MTLDNYQNTIKNLQSNLLNYAFILTSDRSAAYDLLQDTTAAVLSKREDYTGEQTLKDWAFDTMHTIFQKKYPRAIHPVHVGGTPARIVNFEVDETVPYCADWLVEEPRLTTEIFAIVDSEEAACIKLFVKGYNLNEIANRRGMSTSDIHNRLATAIRRLLDNIQG